MPPSKHIPGNEKYTPKRSTPEREADFVEIARLYCRGLTHQEIADWLNANRPYRLSRGSISKDVTEIFSRWEQSVKADVERFKLHELGKLDVMEREYWDAWERSKLDVTFKSQTTNASDEKHSTVSKTSRDGNPAFLQGVMACIDQRCRILGIYAPTKIEATGANGGPMTILHGVSDEHIDRILGDHYKQAAVGDAPKLGPVIDTEAVGDQGGQEGEAESGDA